MIFLDGVTALILQGFQISPRNFVGGGLGSFSKVVVTFDHVGRPFIFSSTNTGDVWIIPSFQIWGYVLHVEYVSCVITNCGQHHWVIPSPLNSFIVLIGGKHYRKLLSYLPGASELKINSLWPSDTIWQHRPGPPSAQVMAWCLMAPSHYLNQYWLLINRFLWHSPKTNFTRSAHNINS